MKVNESIKFFSYENQGSLSLYKIVTIKSFLMRHDKIVFLYCPVLDLKVIIISLLVVKCFSCIAVFTTFLINDNIKEKVNNITELLLCLSSKNLEYFTSITKSFTTPL